MKIEANVDNVNYVIEQGYFSSKERLMINGTVCTPIGRHLYNDPTNSNVSIRVKGYISTGYKLLYSNNKVVDVIKYNPLELIVYNLSYLLFGFIFFGQKYTYFIIIGLLLASEFTLPLLYIKPYFRKHWYLGVLIALADIAIIFLIWFGVNYLLLNGDVARIFIDNLFSSTSK